VALDSYNLARVYASPLHYNTDSDQATLYRSLGLRITYHLSSSIGLVNLNIAPTDLAPQASFAVTATLIHPGTDPVAVTGTLALQDDLGQVAAVQEFDGNVPGGGEEAALALTSTAPITEGFYSLVFTVYHEGNLEVVGHQFVNVAGGRITSLSAPTDLPAGQEVVFDVTFANRRSAPFEGLARVTVYSAEGLPVVELESPIGVGGGGEQTVSLPWDSYGAPPGPYVAAAEVVSADESARYGVLQERFDLVYAIYLPLVLRGYP